MSSDPQPPSDGSALPPRHRPPLGNLAKDTTESDLWSFDDLEDGADSPALKPEAGSIPVSRLPEKSKPRPMADEGEGARPVPKLEGIRTNIGAKRSHLPSGQPAGTAPPSLNDFDDLEDWEVEAAPAPVEAPAPAVAAMPVSMAAGPGIPPEIPQEMPPLAEETPAPAPTSAGAPAAPAPRPKLNLKKPEWIGISVFAALLLGTGAWVYSGTLLRLPEESARTQASDFPVTGKFVTVTAADSCWRAPVVDGPEADTFRRDTVLLPEVVLTAGDKGGAIRLLFRDAEGAGVGDAVTRTVKPGETVHIPATAGFEDAGMHAAYLLGKGRRWTVEVMEASSAQSTDFQRLMLMNLSTELR